MMNNIYGYLFGDNNSNDIEGNYSDESLDGLRSSQQNPTSISRSSSSSDFGEDVDWVLINQGKSGRSTPEMIPEYELNDIDDCLSTVSGISTPKTSGSGNESKDNEMKNQNKMSMRQLAAKQRMLEKAKKEEHKKVVRAKQAQKNLLMHALFSENVTGVEKLKSLIDCNNVVDIAFGSNNKNVLSSKGKGKKNGRK
uniref:BZIP domain-containing protein n=1 Tax=Strongyloides papillosus TaxID=174720 RepID=A0A0N5BA43_STREA